MPAWSIGSQLSVPSVSITAAVTDMTANSSSMYGSLPPPRVASPSSERGLIWGIRGSQITRLAEQLSPNALDLWPASRTFVPARDDLLVECSFRCFALPPGEIQHSKHGDPA